MYVFGHFYWDEFSIYCSTGIRNIFIIVCLIPKETKALIFSLCDDVLLIFNFSTSIISSSPCNMYILYVGFLIFGSECFFSLRISYIPVTNAYDQCRICICREMSIFIVKRGNLQSPLKLLKWQSQFYTLKIILYTNIIS